MNKKLLGQANGLLEIQGTDGTWNYDNYMTGLYNGMELIISIFEKREPKYKSCEGHSMEAKDSLYQTAEKLPKGSDILGLKESI